MAPRRNDARPRSVGPHEAPNDDARRVRKSAATRPKRPGRPFKLSRSDSSRSQSTRSGLSASPSVAPPERRRALSRLETLPVEVIENIFLYSLNLSLPRASPSLAAALSREHLFGLLITLAFWDDPMITQPLGPTMAAMLAPLDYAPLGRAARKQLQESIFRCRWCTLDRLRDQVPTIINMTLHRLWINMDIEMQDDQQRALTRFMKRQAGENSSFLGEGGPNDVLADRIRSPRSRARHSHEMQHEGPHQYRLDVQPNVYVQIYSPTVPGEYFQPAIELGAFPAQFLRGRPTGFSAEDVMFLEFLRLCSHNFNDNCGPSHFSATTVDRMALHQGVKNAIRTQNLDALTSLLKIDEFVHDFGPHDYNEEVGLPPYTIPSDHFVTVTRVGRSNPRLNLLFFETLVRASAESVPTNSLEVTQWTVDNIQLAEQDPSQYEKTNGNFARWLSNFILRLPVHIEAMRRSSRDKQGRLGGQLFSSGALNLSIMEGILFSEEVLQPRDEDFGNYMGESPFHPEQFWLK